MYNRHEPQESCTALVNHILKQHILRLGIAKSIHHKHGGLNELSEQGGTVLFGDRSLVIAPQAYDRETE